MKEIAAELKVYLYEHKLLQQARQGGICHSTAGNQSAVWKEAACFKSWRNAFPRKIAGVEAEFLMF